MIVMDEMSRRTSLAGLTAPTRVRVAGAAGQDDLLLWADASTPQTGALLYTDEGYRMGEIALGYVDECGEIVRFDEYYGHISELAVGSPLSEMEQVDLQADRATSLAWRAKAKRARRRGGRRSRGQRPKGTLRPSPAAPAVPAGCEELQALTQQSAREA